jgi:hypothetical protein
VQREHLVPQKTRELVHREHNDKLKGVLVPWKQLPQFQARAPYSGKGRVSCTPRSQTWKKWGKCTSTYLKVERIIWITTVYGVTVNHLYNGLNKWPSPPLAYPSNPSISFGQNIKIFFKRSSRDVKNRTGSEGHWQETRRGLEIEYMDIGISFIARIITVRVWSLSIKTTFCLSF